MSAENAIWSAVIMAALALMIAGVVMSSGNTSKGATPAAPPPEVIRTDVLIGRMVCEQKGPHGCVEWRIYRTLEH